MKKFLKKMFTAIRAFFSTTSNYQDGFGHNPLYFSRYNNSTAIFSRAWWYAFGSAFLYFVPTFGMILEIINLINHYGHYLAFGFPPVLIAIAACVALVSFVLACYEFKQILNRCRNAHKNGELLKALMCKLRWAWMTLKDQDNSSLPDLIKADVAQPIADPNHGIFNKMKKFLKLSIHSILGSIGWLFTISAFTGLGVFSTVSLVSIPFLGFISPLFLAIIFIVVNLLVAAWVHGIFDARFEHHQSQQERCFIECSRKYQLVRQAGQKKLSTHWADEGFASDMLKPDGSLFSSTTPEQKKILTTIWDNKKISIPVILGEIELDGARFDPTPTPIPEPSI